MHVAGDQLFHDNGGAMRFLPSPNHGGRVAPLYLIVHYTANTSFPGAVQWLLKPAASASAHIVVGRGGECVQLVPLDTCAWHAGRSQWDGLENLNAHSIGIELVNAGGLERTPAGEWTDWAGHHIPAGEIVMARHKDETFERGWHVFPDVQIARALEIARALHRRYRFRDVLGHDDVSPRRKIDPGPAFPMKWFAGEVLGTAVTVGEDGR